MKKKGKIKSPGKKKGKKGKPVLDKFLHRAKVAILMCRIKQFFFCILSVQTRLVSLIIST